MQRNNSAYNGYVGGYITKKPKPPQLELKKLASRLNQLEERHACSTRQTLGRAFSGRLISDIECGGTRRGAVEVQHLCINARLNDSFFAEFPRSFQDLHVGATEWFNRLETAVTKYSVENPEVLV